MRQGIDSVLDQCLTDVLSGEATVEECLAEHPDQAPVLRSLVEIAVQVRQLDRPRMEAGAQEAGRRRMLAALAQRRRRQGAQVPAVSRWTREVVSFIRVQSEASLGRSRPALRSALAAAILLVLLLAPGFVSQNVRGLVVAQQARLTSPGGVVEVQKGPDGAWQQAGSGLLVGPGFRIRTGDLSGATLSFFDGSVTRLAPGTDVTVTQLSSRRDGFEEVVVLYQWAGETRNSVARLPDAASRFEIHTSTVLAIVHGTEFTVGVTADDGTQVSVTEGVVEVVGQVSTVMLTSGQMTSAESGDLQDLSVTSMGEMDDSPRLGAVVGEPERSEQMQRQERPPRGQRPAHAQTAQHPEQPQHPEKPEHPEHPEKPQHPEHPEHPEKPERPKGRDK
jgi:hypothetical protein